MQAESSYTCCRLQHGCRFVQLHVLGVAVLVRSLRAGGGGESLTLERGSNVSARVAPGWVSGSNGDGGRRGGK